MTADLVTTRLQVRYHRQDDDDLCGAAAVQMVVAFLQDGRILVQDDLEKEIAENNATRVGAGHAPEDEWDADPVGLQKTLNAHLDLRHGFEVTSDVDRGVAENAVVRAIEDPQVPPLVLTDEGGHWKVIKGCQMRDGEPVAWFALDPWPAPTVARYPPHTLQDRCGLGVQFGTAEEHIPIEAWRRSFDAVETPGQWQGRFVAVTVDGAPRTRGARVEPFLRPAAKRAPRATRLGAVAWSHLEEYGLFDLSDWREALQDTTPGEPEFASDYCTVQMIRSSNGSVTVPVVVRMDAASHEYLGARRAAPGGSLAELSARKREKFLHAIQNRPENRHLEPAAVILQPQLHWEMCCESSSPWDPFFVFRTPERTLYVRHSDGAVFEDLTPRWRAHPRPIATARRLYRLEDELEA